MLLQKRVNDKVAASCGFVNRGVKNEDFYVIYHTKALAILVEVCFCDSKSDFDKLDTEKVAIAICEGLTGEDYNVKVPKPQITDNLYRVRKSWGDVKSQIGAYRILENAKKECDSRSGYSVFDKNGVKVYPIAKAENPRSEKKLTSNSQKEKIIKQYSERGLFTCTVDAINFRNKPYVGGDNLYKVNTIGGTGFIMIM